MSPADDTCVLPGAATVGQAKLFNPVPLTLLMSASLKQSLVRRRVIDAGTELRERASIADLCSRVKRFCLGKAARTRGRPNASSGLATKPVWLPRAPNRHQMTHKKIALSPNERRASIHANRSILESVYALLPRTGARANVLQDFERRYVTLLLSDARGNVALAAHKCTARI